MLFFNYNGKLFKENTAIIGPDNRGIRYGDGLFETIKCKNGVLILTDEHLARLWNGIRILQFNPSKLFTPDMLEKEIYRLLEKNNHTTARVRLSVTRGNGGLYDTNDHSPQFVIQSWPLEIDSSRLNQNGLQLCIYPHAKKAVDAFSNLKHNNFLPYFMGALYARELKCNDAIILNTADRVCDTTIANIFLISGNTITTVSLEEGCIAGVMRAFVIRTLKLLGYEIKEKVLTTNDLASADEVFLTNSIFNMKWVAAIGEKKYSNTLTTKIFHELLQTNPSVFC